MRMERQDAFNNATPTSLFENILHVGNHEYESTC